MVGVIRPTAFNFMKRRWTEWIAERLVYACGGCLVVVIVLIGYYLVHESKYAFSRTFAYGYRFAFQPDILEPDPYTGETVDDLTIDPNSTLLAAHFEGEDGLDDHEESAPLLDLSGLSGFSSLATGTPLVNSIDKMSPSQLYRDDLRTPKYAHQGERFYLLGFATEEYKKPTLKLAWQPDASFDPSTVPYDFRLRLVKIPSGIKLEPFEIDLKSQPTGKVELPTWIARSDEDRASGYVFEFEAIPQTTNTLAVLSGLFSTDWSPTLQYPRFGFIPLLLGTLLMSIFAMLIAAPIGVLSAIYLSEIAPRRIRELLKPIIELLASVPTVVLGYFGVMLVAPSLVRVFGEAVQMSSARCMLTAIIVLSILLLPTVTSLTEDSLRAVPKSLREGAEAIGCTFRESMKHVVLKAARAGIVATLLLTFARGVGETMVIWMLSGGTATMPSMNLYKTVTSSTRGVPDTIAIEMGNVTFEGVHYGHLFLIGLILFVITLVINLLGFTFVRRRGWQA